MCTGSALRQRVSSTLDDQCNTSPIADSLFSDKVHP